MEDKKAQFALGSVVVAGGVVTIMILSAAVLIATKKNDSLQPLADIVTTFAGIATIVVATYAINGIGAWQKEVRFSHLFDVYNNALVGVRTYQFAFKRLRDDAIKFHFDAAQLSENDALRIRRNYDESTRKLELAAEHLKHAANGLDLFFKSESGPYVWAGLADHILTDGGALSNSDHNSPRVYFDEILHIANRNMEKFYSELQKMESRIRS